MTKSVPPLTVCSVYHPAPDTGESEGSSPDDCDTDSDAEGSSSAQNGNAKAYVVPNWGRSKDAVGDRQQQQQQQQQHKWQQQRSRGRSKKEQGGKHGYQEKQQTLGGQRQQFLHQPQPQGSSTNGSATNGSCRNRSATNGSAESGCGKQKKGEAQQHQAIPTLLLPPAQRSPVPGVKQEDLERYLRRPWRVKSAAALRAGDEVRFEGVGVFLCCCAVKMVALMLCVQCTLPQFNLAKCLLI